MTNFFTTTPGLFVSPIKRVWKGTRPLHLSALLACSFSTSEFRAQGPSVRQGLSPQACTWGGAGTSDCCLRTHVSSGCDFRQWHALCRKAEAILQTTSTPPRRPREVLFGNMSVFHMPPSLWLSKHTLSLVLKVWCDQREGGVVWN